MKPKKKGTVRRLYAYTKGYRGKLFLALLLLLAATLIFLAQPKLIQGLLDDDLAVIVNGQASEAEKAASIADIRRIGLLTLVLLVLACLFMFIECYLFDATGAEIIRQMRQDLYQHILALPMSFFDKHTIGSLVTRMTNDTEAVSELFSMVLRNIFKNVFSFVGIIVIMFSLNWQLACLVLLLTPFIAAVSIIFRQAIRKVYEKSRAVLSTINSKLAENIAGMDVIQVFDRQQPIYKEFDQTNEEYLGLARKEVRYFSIYRPAIEILRALGLASLIWFGGKDVIAGRVSFGIIYAFLNYIQQFFEPILNMAMTFNVIQSALTSADRIFRLMDEPEEEYEGKLAVPSEGFEGDIVFDHVWFRYDKGAGEEEAEWILKDVSFHVHPGEFVAFVGATGAGKSTIMGLIARFYSIDRGEIRLDGRNIEDFPVRDLRRAIGLVQQDVFLFSGSVLDNITVWREEASRRQAVEAAKQVDADGFIKQLRKGYDEQVMERGAAFSSGERQLLSFARAINSNPSILILDEATSHIDTETEQIIQHAISSMAKDRTMIAVAHRISTISDADNIIVMDHGEIAEEGTKDELLQQNGLFRVLYELQFQEDALA